MSDWQILIEPTGDWVSLPVEGDADADSFAAEQTQWLSDEAGRTVMAHQLATFARRAQEQGAVAAGCLPTDDWTNVHAYVEVLVAPAGTDDGLPTDLRELESALTPHDTTWSEVSRPALPAGEAVRVHLIDAEEAPPAEEDVVESVTHALPTPGADNVALVTVSWTDLSSAEEMIALADETAQTLRFEPVDA